MSRSYAEPDMARVNKSSGSLLSGIVIDSLLIGVEGFLGVESLQG